MTGQGIFDPQGVFVKLRRSLTIGSLVASLLLLFSCGGGDGGASSTTTPPATGSESPSPTPEGAPVTIAVNQSFWFAGFRVTVGSATFDPAPDGGSPQVTIDATYENQGTDPAIFDGTLSLAAGGSFFEPGIGLEIPNVPGLSTGAGTIPFAVDESFSFDDAVLTIGLAENNQAVIPLGGTGEAVTLEPTTLLVTGTASGGEVTVEVQGGELRADVPEEHSEIAKGHLALTLDFAATYTGDFAGGYAFAYSGNLALRLPDGTTVAPDEGPIELLRAGTTLPDVSVRFTVNDPPAGTYALVVIDTVMEDARGELEFEIA